MLKCTRLKYEQYTLQIVDCPLSCLEPRGEIGSTIRPNRGFGLDKKSCQNGIFEILSRTELRLPYYLAAPDRPDPSSRRGLVVEFRTRLPGAEHWVRLSHYGELHINKLIQDGTHQFAGWWMRLSVLTLRKNPGDCGPYAKAGCPELTSAYPT